MKIQTFYYRKLWFFQKVWVAYRGYKLEHTTFSTQGSTEAAAILLLLDYERRLANKMETLNKTHA